MAEPLSLGASVIGILSVAGHVSKKLFDFIQNTREAPDQAHETLREVNDLRVILAQCQTLLSRNEQSSVPGASHLLVEDVATVITSCVLSFSKLERLLIEVETENELNVIDRMKWAWREKKLARITGRLISQKQSLDSMVTILGCTYQANALELVSELKSTIQTILANQNGLSERICAFESGHTHKSLDMPTNDKDEGLSFTQLQEGATTQKELRKHGGERHGSAPTTVTAEAANSQAAYVEELQGSKVYRRILSGSSGASTGSFATRMTPWSELSGCSLADVSMIFDIKLPTDASDLRQTEIRRTETSVDKTSITAEKTEIMADLSEQQKQMILNYLTNIMGTGYKRYDMRYHMHDPHNFYEGGRRVVAELKAVLETGLKTPQVVLVPQNSIKRHKPLEKKKRKHTQQGQGGGVSSAKPLIIIPEEPEPTLPLKTPLSPTDPLTELRPIPMGAAMTGSGPPAA